MRRKWELREMAHSELIKNFEKIRDYMKEFYVYGFKSRDDFRKKSARSYDNERRRIESYMGDYLSFHKTKDGKNVFISVDTKNTVHNPLYKAFKSKSFTDGDITLHFILFDILYSKNIKLSLKEITEIIDTNYLSHFPQPMLFDESNIRKKLNEYKRLGLIDSKKQGNMLLYWRKEAFDLKSFADALSYFSEVGQLGVIGSFLIDKMEGENEHFVFKHHYINGALDSDIMCKLLLAMGEKRQVTIRQTKGKNNEKLVFDVVPLRIYISTQSGRQNLMAFGISSNEISPYRLDYITEVKIGERYANFDSLRDRQKILQKSMWGICCNPNKKRLEKVEFVIRINDLEEYIFDRLEREKRCGTVERLDKHTARFRAEIYDSMEMLPWIRTFICRIMSMNFSNRSVENKFKIDIEKMYELYDISGGDINDIP